jgi:hypothetical protein
LRPQRPLQQKVNVWAADTTGTKHLPWVRASRSANGPCFAGSYDLSCEHNVIKS